MLGHDGSDGGFEGCELEHLEPERARVLVLLIVPRTTAVLLHGSVIRPEQNVADSAVPRGLGSPVVVSAGL